MMSKTEQKIRDALGLLLVPDVNRSLAMLNLVRHLSITGGRVEISLANIGFNNEAKGKLRSRKR
ncbi:hypothetical protein ACFLVN_03250 [Chloroflexota bacterium]